jgi:hypothetical protein
VGAGAHAGGLTVFAETRGPEFFRKPIFDARGPKRTSTTREQIVDVFAGEVQEKYENKNLDGDEAFLIGLSTLFEQPPSVA